MSRLAIAIFCSWMASAHVVSAAASAYFDRGAFLAACQGLPGVKQTLSFEPYRDSGAWLVPGNEHPSEVTLAGVTFKGRELTLGESGGRVFLWNFQGVSALSVHFNQGARAFGADLLVPTTESYTSYTATVTLDTGEVFSFTAPVAPNSKFFGFVSTDSITNLTFSDGLLNGLHEENIGNIQAVLGGVPRPRLVITGLAPDTIYFQWPAENPGFELQSARDLSPTSWQGGPPGRLEFGGYWRAAVPRIYPITFYRLVTWTDW